ncbi:MAG: aminodeoxychorismate synthase, component I [Gallionellaceae bacterium CG1_02_60_325]|nr:MAG: aminodeoxychorismate synthase, component I [Gallionellaceae bacterium CG1_02_60_325]PIV48017.1 MAG: aminodeoxychorismate synthase, component I [Gallionellaceae bacterium CG02_land_8_20_14_3_00_60_115]
MLYRSALPYFPDAGTYFTALRDLPCAAWLDSGGSGCDVLAAAPVATISREAGKSVLRAGAEEHRTDTDPFELIRQQLGTLEAVPDIPFAGGALGYWGYDLARDYLRLPPRAHDGEQLAQMVVGIYDWAVVIDHPQRKACLVSRLRHPGTRKVLPQILQRLLAADPGKIPRPDFQVRGGITSNLSAREYRSAFDAIKQFLHAGDCYQVNLAQRFSAEAGGDAWAAYLELRRLSPAPYSAYLDWPHVQILCVSPELFLQVRNGEVETRPIKGTRARSADSAEDARRARALRCDPKDRAENLMIVDLLRNDLARNCATGSVRAPQLFGVESYSNVHHLVSTVTGKLRAGCDALDLLRDSFPGGSITGAPKIRAMEIIEQLEPHRRGIYCGAIGYAGDDGNMQTNIAIRTLVYSRGEIRGWAGGAIVADSDCAGEYQETRDKASAMLEVLRRFGGKLDW